MSLERVIALAPTPATTIEIAISDDATKGLKALAGYRKEYKDLRRGFTIAIRKEIEYLKATAVVIKKMLDFRYNFLNFEFDRAIEAIIPGDGISVPIIIPDMKENPEERIIEGKLVGLMGFYADWGAPTFDGIASVKLGKKKDYVAVQVSEIGTTWLNPAHLKPANREKSGKEVVLQLFSPSKPRRRKKV